MTTIAYWGTSIRGRWFKRGLLAALTLLAAAALSATDTSELRLGQGINSYNLHDYGGASDAFLAELKKSVGWILSPQP